MHKLFVDFDGTIAEFKCVGADAYSAPGYSLTLVPYKNVVSSIKHIIRKNLNEQGRIYRCKEGRCLFR